MDKDKTLADAIRILLKRYGELTDVREREAKRPELEAHLLKQLQPLDGRGGETLDVDPWFELAKNPEQPDADLIQAAKKVLRIDDDAAPLLHEIPRELPKPLLAARNQGGAVLSLGYVSLLAGAGGAAKSTLALHVAIGVAMTADKATAELHGKVFDGMGGPVLYATYEDTPAVIAWRGEKLLQHIEAVNAKPPVHVLGMRGKPLFGPSGPNQVGKLPGWERMFRAARRVKPRLLIIDPALSAYVGESNAAAPVRSFLDALTDEAEALGAGVLLIAHSNKTARGGADPYDPGQVGGSGHWVDGVRGVLTLTQPEKHSDMRRLSIAKANYGPSYIGINLEPIRYDSGAIVGFKAPKAWDKGQATAGNGQDRKTVPAGPGGGNPYEE